MKCFFLIAIGVSLFILVGSGISSVYFISSFLRTKKETCTIQSQIIFNDKGMIKLNFQNNLINWVEVCDEFRVYRDLWDCIQEKYPLYKNITCYVNEKTVRISPFTFFNIHEVLFIVSLASTAILLISYYLYRSRQQED